MRIAAALARSEGADQICANCSRGTGDSSSAVWLADWQRMPERPWADLETDPASIRLLDQILYRFLKLQDAVGERLTPATLDALAEPFEDWPMRDRLERLERLGFLDALQWLEWRGIRNRLAHEYPDTPALRWAALRAALAAAHDLVACTNRWLDKLAAAG